MVRCPKEYDLDVEEHYLTRKQYYDLLHEHGIDARMRQRTDDNS